MKKLCIQDGCHEKRHGRGYCRHHYEEIVRGVGKTVYANRLRENKALLLDGKKRCSKCREVKTLDGYLPKKDGLGGVRAECGDCFYLMRKCGKGRDIKLRQDERRNRRNGAKPRPTRLTEADRQASESRLVALKQLRDVRFGFAFDHMNSECNFRADVARIIFKSYYKDGRTIQPWHDPRASEAEKYRIRYKFDKEFAISERIRRQVTKQRRKLHIHDKMRSALARGGESPTVSQAVGYSIAELRKHLERQFTKGMTWDRFMAGEIHIDHILPVSSFDMESSDEVKECWSLSNLRPMWAKDNLAKAGRIETLI